MTWKECTNSSPQDYRYDQSETPRTCRGVFSMVMEEKLYITNIYEIHAAF